MKRLVSILICSIFLAAVAEAQVPRATLVKILKAEDSRTYDGALEKLLSGPSAAVRKRAALAAGRIGDDRAVPALWVLLRDRNAEVAVAAAFALGETESAKASGGILEALEAGPTPRLQARLLEAAGKIAAANPTDPRTKDLQDAIVVTLQDERAKDRAGDPVVVRAGLTALLRARPAEALETAAQFLATTNPEVRADASNTYARLRGNKMNQTFRGLLLSDEDAVVRANAARALGVGGDVGFTKQLLEAAVGDNDSRVRVSAVRALGTLNDPSAAVALTQRGYVLLEAARKSRLRRPDEKSEFLEIATVLGRLLQFTSEATAISLLSEFRVLDGMASPETEIALARIAPGQYLGGFRKLMQEDFKPADEDVPAVMQAFAEIARMPDERAETVKKDVKLLLVQLLGAWATERGAHPDEKNLPDPSELVNAFAEFKSPNTSEILRPFLSAEEDVRTRAALASVLGRQPAGKENFEAVKAALDFALKNDKKSDDAVLASMEALFAIDKKAAIPSLVVAAKSANSIVRRRAVEMLRNPDIRDHVVDGFADSARMTRWPGGSVSKLGQVTLGDRDYLAAASRRNGTVKAVFTTEKGSFTVDLLPEDAPLTVHNFITLARRNYFNGLTVHRVVPNFVMQDGDPDDTGSGGPGWNIRCEMNMVPYDRGAVGMALSGKDTGGSQWFVTHSPQPHLDGGYTVFGRVSEKDMKVVDRIVRGDRILTVRIIGK